MNHTDKPGTPLEPYLIPDGPEGSGPAPLVAALTPVINMATKGKPPAAIAKNRLRRPTPEKFTLDEAFDLVLSDEVNVEKAVRSVGFLLHWCSSTGNAHVNGWLAEGLGHVLDFTANQFTYAFGAQKHELTQLREIVSQLVKEKAENTRAPRK